jgi:hypothetical protein
MFAVPGICSRARTRTGREAEMNELPFCVVPEDSEVLFSMVARCTARYGAVGQESVVRRLTGQRRLRPLLSAIPGFVKRIAEHVPYGNRLADSTFTIQKHTSMPYFTFFLGIERAQTVIGELTGGSNAHDVFMSIGLAAYPLTEPRDPQR